MGNLAFPPIAIGPKALLVVVGLFTRLGRKFEIGPFDDGIDGTGLLAEAAERCVKMHRVMNRTCSMARALGWRASWVATAGSNRGSLGIKRSEAHRPAHDLTGGDDGGSEALEEAARQFDLG